MKRKFVIAILLCMMLSLTTACMMRVDRAVQQPTESGRSTSEPTPQPASPPEPEEESLTYPITSSRVRTYTDSIGTPWAQVIVEIENTGSANLYLSSGSYDLEDENGKLIATETLASLIPNVIGPGEKGYLYEETILDSPVEGEVTVAPKFVAKRAAVKNIQFEVTEIELSETRYGGLKAIGRVENTSAEESVWTAIEFILLDAEEIPIAMLSTNIREDLAPGDKIGFEATNLSLPDDITIEDVSDYHVYAYPLQMQVW